MFCSARYLAQPAPRRKFRESARLGTPGRAEALHLRNQWRKVMGRNVTLSLGALILLVIVVALLF